MVNQPQFARQQPKLLAIMSEDIMIPTDVILDSSNDHKHDWKTQSAQRQPKVLKESNLERPPKTKDNCCGPLTTT